MDRPEDAGNPTSGLCIAGSSTWTDSIFFFYFPRPAVKMGKSGHNKNKQSKKDFFCKK